MRVRLFFGPDGIEVEIINHSGKQCQELRVSSRKSSAAGFERPELEEVPVHAYGYIDL